MINVDHIVYDILFKEKSVSDSSKHLLLVDPETCIREKYAATSTALGRQACARRAGANKSLSNCSLKNPVAPSRNGARQRPAALKPGFNVLYFASTDRRSAWPAGKSGLRSPGGLFIDIYSRRWQGMTRIDGKGCTFVREDNVCVF